jgi:DNA mismatch endonuclease (patch repair protein)
MEVYSITTRSYKVSLIRNMNTGSEKPVRSLLHRDGYRFRLQARDLLGKSDLVFRRRRKVVFVRGCFWHMRSCPNGQLKPATNSGSWEDKRHANVERDKRSEQQLMGSCWGVAVALICELNETTALLKCLEASRRNHGNEYGKARAS